MQPEYKPLLQLDSEICEEYEAAAEKVEDDTHHLDGLAADCIEKDVVQFTTYEFYAIEGQGPVTVNVLRIGQLSDTSIVHYRTKDASAKDGVKYRGVQGQLIFEKGEAFKTIEIEVIVDSVFDTTQSFMVELYDCKNCFTDPRLTRVPVFLLDDDLFPSNSLRKEILADDPNVLMTVSKSLMYEYFMFVFTCVPTIRCKSIAIIILDQIRNVYYLCTIYLRVYLVDTILNLHDPEAQDRLIFPGNAGLSAIAVAAAYSLPQILIACIDRYIVGSLDLGFNIRKHHRVNLFRKFLHYTRSARLEVSAVILSGLCDDAVPELVEGGYLGVFHMLKEAGKICCVAFFMVSKDVKNSIPLILFPLIIMTWITRRLKSQLALSERSAEESGKSQELLDQAAHSKEVVNEYKQTHRLVMKYEELLDSQRELTRDLRIFEFYNEQLVPLLAISCIGVYMGAGAQTVLLGSQSVGTFLATINAFKDLGDRFSSLYERIDKFQNAVQPLMDLTQALNLPNHLTRKMNINLHRTEFLKRSLVESKGVGFTFWEKIPITFQNVNIDHIHTLRNFNAKMSLRSFVVVYAKSGHGKTALLKLISGHAPEKFGQVLFPPHYSCLELVMVPRMLGWLNLLDNVRFGRAGDMVSINKIRDIFKQVTGYDDKHWLMKKLDAEIQAENRAEDGDAVAAPDKDWLECLSHLEMKYIHLVRALVSGAHIYILHKTLDDVHSNVAERFLDIFRRLAHGIHPDKKHRAVFLSIGNDYSWNQARPKADYIWDLEQGTMQKQAQTVSPRSSSKELVVQRSVGQGTSDGVQPKKRSQNDAKENATVFSSDLSGTKVPLSSPRFGADQSSYASAANATNGDTMQQKTEDLFAADGENNGFKWSDLLVPCNSRPADRREIIAFSESSPPEFGMPAAQDLLDLEALSSAQPVPALVSRSGEDIEAQLSESQARHDIATGNTYGAEYLPTANPKYSPGKFKHFRLFPEDAPHPT